MATNLRDRGYSSSMDNYNAQQAKKKREEEERKKRESQQGPVSVLRANQLKQTNKTSQAPASSAGSSATNQGRAVSAVGPYGQKNTGTSLTAAEFNRSTAMQEAYGSYTNYLLGRRTTSGGFFSKPDTYTPQKNAYDRLMQSQQQVNIATELLKDARNAITNNHTSLLPGYTKEKMKPTRPTAGFLDQNAMSRYSRAVDVAQTAVENYNANLRSLQKFNDTATALDKQWWDTIRTRPEVQKEIDEIKKRIEDYQKKNTDLQRSRSTITSTQASGVMPWQLERAMNDQEEIKRNEASIDELRERLNLLNEEMEWAFYKEYKGFADQEMPVSVQHGGYGDSIFKDTVNQPYTKGQKAASYLSMLSPAVAMDQKIGGVFDPSNVAQMNDEERRTYNTIYQQMGEDAAIKYYQDLENISLRTRRRASEEREVREWVKDLPLFAQRGLNILSAVASPAKSLAYVNQAADYIINGQITKDASYNRLAYLQSALRTQVGEDVDEHNREKYGTDSFWGIKWGSFGTQMEASTADFLFNMWISGGWGVDQAALQDSAALQAYADGARTAEAIAANAADTSAKMAEIASLSLMGTTAAADTVMECKDRGLEDWQCFVLGTGAGFLEAATEIFSIEELMKGLGDRNFFMYLLKNFGAESSEEIASSLGNLWLDTWVAKDQSEWHQAILQYKKENRGASDEDAVKAVWKDQAMQTGLEGLAGGLSGLGMAFGNYAMNYGKAQIGYNKYMNTSLTDTERLNGIVEQGKLAGMDSEAFVLAKQIERKLANGQQISIREAANAEAAIKDSVLDDFKKKNAEKLGERLVATENGLEQLEQDVHIVMNSNVNRHAKETATKILLQLNNNEQVATKDAGEVFLAAVDAIDKIQAQQQAKMETKLVPREVTDDMTELEKSAARVGVSEELTAQMQGVADALGLNIRFFSEEAKSYERDGKRYKSTHNGHYDSNTNTIFVNALAKNPFMQVTSHEMTHQLEQTETYKNSLQQMILDQIDDLDQKIKDKIESYSRQGVTLKNDDEAKFELVAEWVENNLLGDEKKILSLAKKNRTLIEWARDVLDKILVKLGNNEERDAAEHRQQLEKIRDVYAKALQEIQPKESDEITLPGEKQAASNTETAEQAQEQIDKLPDKTEFDMEEEVEKSGSLIAVHNIEISDIPSMLSMGAFAAPSIAVMQYGKLHNGFGDASFIFHKNAIDPQADPRNKVYGADAWTPSFWNLDMEFRVDNKQLRQIENDVQALATEFVNSNGLYWPRIPENNYFNFVTAQDVDAARIGADLFANYRADKYEIRAAYLEEMGKVPDDDIIENANNGDNRSLKTWMIENAPAEDVARWLEKKVQPAFSKEPWLFDLRKGRYDKNNKLIPFDETHVPKTAENVVEYMYRDVPSRAGAAVNADINTLIAVAAREYKSIDEMHEHERNLSHDVAYNYAKKNEFNWKLLNIMDEIEDMDEDTFFGSIIESVADDRDLAEVFRESGHEVEPYLIDEINNIVEQIKDVPSKYFEAKPERAISFDNAAGCVVPRGTPQDIIDLLKKNGFEIKTYATKEQRLEAVNSFKDAAFSMTEEIDQTQTHTDNFKKWFGDWEKDPKNASKIVNPDGTPRVVYHGTNSYIYNENGVEDFWTFDKDFIGSGSGDGGFFGRGFYFAFTKVEAQFYGSRRIIPAYLNIRNPFNYTKELHYYNGMRGETGYAPDAIATLNMAEKFPEVAKSIVIYEGGKPVTALEFAKQLKDILANKKFKYEEMEDYNGKFTMALADKKTETYEVNGEQRSYDYWDYQSRIYGEPNPADVAVDYLMKTKQISKIPVITHAILDNSEAFTQALKDKGYDGVIQSEDGDEIVAFEPNQIKSATDNVGMFDPDDSDIRHSVTEEEDTEYLNAVETGDMETAQRMVDEAAASAIPNSVVRDKDGNLLRMHHGTDADFTVFDRDHIGQRGRFEGSGFNFTPYDGRARGYGKNVLGGYLNIESPLSATKKTISITKLADIIRNVDPTGDNIIANYARDTNDYGSKSFVEREARTTARAIWKWANNDVDIYSEMSAVSPDSDSLIEYFSNAGYDGVIHYDEDGRIRTAVAFDSNQFKLADPVTYDDSGKPIPLSERFNPENKDIRYSQTEEEDADYINAVETGDTKSAKRMVEDAAIRWGAAKDPRYKNVPLHLYHGTPRFGFTEFKDSAHETPFIYTSTKREVSAHYAGDQNYAGVRKIGRKYRNGNNINDIIENAKWVLDSKYHVMTNEEKENRYSEVKETARKVSEKVLELYEKNDMEFPEDIWNAISVITYAPDGVLSSDVEWEIEHHGATLFDVDPEQRKSIAEDLDSYYDRIDELRRKVQEYKNENWNSLTPAAKQFLSYVTGYELGDTLIDIHYSLVPAMTDDTYLINEAGNINKPEDLKASMDKFHNIGAYDLFGNLGNNPFEFDANGAQFWGIKVPEIGDDYYSTDTVSKWALDNGYTSVIMHNIYDYGDKADNYVFFDSSQLKSADTVTYDDNGDVIPLSERFNAEKSDMRYSISEAEDDIGYHAGDLGKAEYLRTQGRGRGTGHFGTGTYFVGTKEKVTEDSHYGKRPQHAVDFSDYNLYKVRNDREGYRLHDALREIDGGLDETFVKKAAAGEFFALRFSDIYNTAKEKFGESLYGPDYEKNMISVLTDYAKQNGIEIQSREEYLKDSEIDEADKDFYYLEYLKETVEKAVDEVNNEYDRFRRAVDNLEFSFHFDRPKIINALNAVLDYQKATPRYSKSDSYATVFMKAMGYDGIDVRGTGLDNTGYGSVIYDIKDHTIRYSKSEDLQLEGDAATDLEQKGFGVQDGAVAYNLTTLENSEVWNDPGKVAKEIAEAIGISERKAKKYIKSLSNIAYVIASDKERLDYASAPGQSAFVSNTEYGGSFDYTTLCTKRRYMTGTISAIQKNFAKKGLTATEFLTIRKMLEDRGYTVSCPMCYVEGSRTKMAEYAEDFQAEWMAKYGEAEAPTISQLTDPEQLEQLRGNQPEIYDAWRDYLKQFNQQAPKMYFARTAYDGEILKKFRSAKGKVNKENVQAKNLAGGIRFQSFSDFEAVHLLDNMQAITDMARVGLAGQAYTKMIDYVMSMGGTGLKINMSLVAKGIDKNGNLILDETGGMTWDEVDRARNAYSQPVEGMDEFTRKALQRSFSQNVGTIIVVFNDAQLRAAMADDRIDFIIPYHHSQWGKDQYYQMGMPKGTQDYTNQQNESVFKPDGTKGGKTEKNLLPNEYWNPRLSGKRNAEEYLKLCAQKHIVPKFSAVLQNNGDGSYSLQPNGSTDGYWKLLSDYKMYDNEGRFAPQNPVQPLFDDAVLEDILNREDGSHKTYPVAEEVVEEFMALKEQTGEGEDIFEKYVDEREGKGAAERLRQEYKKAQNAIPDAKTRGPLWLKDQAEQASKFYQDTQASMTEEEEGLTLPGLEEQVEKVTKKKKKPAAQSRPIEARKWLNKRTLDRFGVREGSRQYAADLMSKYMDKVLDNGQVTEEDTWNIFNDLLYEGRIDVFPDDYDQAMREFVTGGKIHVPNSVKSDFGEDYNIWKKRAFAAGLLLTDTRTISDASTKGIDTIYENLPGHDPQMTSPEERLKAIIKLAENGMTKQMTLPDYWTEQQKINGESMYDAQERMYRQFDADVRTFAEMAGLEVKLRDRTGVKIAQERERFGEIRDKQFQKISDVRKEERERFRETRQKERERRQISELQQKTLKQLQWLSKNRFRAPEELRGTWDELLGDLDIYAVHAAKETQYSKKYDSTYRDIVNMYKEAMASDPNWLPSKELERIMKRVDGEHLEDLDIDQLRNLYQAITGLRTEFYNRNNAIMENETALFSDIFDETRKQMSEQKGYKDRFLSKLLNEESLTPMNVLRRMVGWNGNSSWVQLAKQLETGERAIRDYKVRAERLLEDFLNENKDWFRKSDGIGKGAIWYEVEVPEFLEFGKGNKPIFGDTIKVYMTPLQKVQMYLESKNYDNLRHMLGGRTFADKALYEKGERARAFAAGKTIKLAPETVRYLVKDLTPTEMKLAKLLENYYNDWSKSRINEVSNKLYGYDKAMNANYAPILTNQNYVGKELGVGDQTAAGVGNMKARIYSKNPSYNVSAIEAFERSVDQTGKFVGLAIAERNWKTLLNWQVKNNSMRDVITHKWDKQGLDYIENLIETMQGHRTRDGKLVLGESTNKLLSNYISAVFGSNPGIVLKQAASLPQFAAVLGWTTAPNPKQYLKVNTDLINIYTSDLAYRQMGYATPETAQLKNNPGLLQRNKALNFVFGGGAITAMDAATVKRGWAWSENYVKRNFPDLAKGTDAQIRNGESDFYKKVAEVFNDAVSTTQPMYDEMHRPYIMKEAKGVARAFTMFKTVPLQQYNTIRRMWGEYSAAATAYNENQTAENKATLKRAAWGAANSITATLGSVLMLEIVELGNAMLKNKGKKYRDKDDELTAESIGTQAAINAAEDFAGMVPAGKELAQFLENLFLHKKWYGIEIPGGQQLNDFIDTINEVWQTTAGFATGLADVIKNDEDWTEFIKRHKAEYASAIKKLVQKTGMYFGGLPLENLEKYIMGGLQYASPDLAQAVENVFSDKNRNTLKGKTGKQLEQGVRDIFKARGIDLNDEALQAITSIYQGGDTSKSLYDERGFERTPYGAELYASAANYYAVPAKTPTSITVSGESVSLSEAEQQKWEREWAKIGKQINSLVKSTAWKNADQDERFDMLNQLYDLAKEKANKAVNRYYEEKDWVEKADAIIEAGASPYQAASWLARSKNKSNAEKFAMIAGEKLRDKEKEAIFGNIVGTDMETEEGNPTRWADYQTVKKLGGTIDQYATWLSETSGMKASEKWEHLAKTDLNPMVKIGIIIGDTGTEVETASGNETQFAKMVRLIDNGLAVNDYCTLRSEYALEIYDKICKQGIDPTQAVETARIVRVVKNDLGPSATVLDYCESVTANVPGTEKQMNALAGIMPSAEYTKLRTGVDLGVEPKYYFIAKRNAKMVDDNGSINQDEATAAVSQLNCSNEQKAILWQMFNKSWKAKKNPFSSSIGQSIYDAMHAEPTETDDTYDPYALSLPE